MVLVIVLAVALIVISTTALIGVDNLSSGFAQQSSSDVVLSAESCVEETILRLSRDNSYTGGTLVLGDVSCTMTVTGVPCGTCTVEVNAIGDDFTRNIRTDVTALGSTVDILSWEEFE